MLRRLGWLIGLSQRSRQTKTLDAEPYVARVKPVLMVDTVQEIAIYIHRFHNLDLFQQGWYQIKISMRWEDGDNNSCGIPSRVVQYEALDSTSNDSNGVWKIDDKDNSFITQPFRIKYAKHDVRLCMMISFTMPLERYEGSATSAVILRFELLYSRIMEDISVTHSDTCPAAVHEFRIPPKAISGVHSYCPVHIDTFHAVLIDVSVHVSVMKSAAYKRPAILSSDASNGKNLASGNVQSSKKAFAQIASADKKLVTLCLKKCKDLARQLVKQSTCLSLYPVWTMLFYLTQLRQENQLKLKVQDKASNKTILYKFLVFLSSMISIPTSNTVDKA